MKYLVKVSIPEDALNKQNLCSALSPKKNGWTTTYTHYHVQRGRWAYGVRRIAYCKWMMTDEEMRDHKKFMKKMRRMPYGAEVESIVLVTL